MSALEFERDGAERYRRGILADLDEIDAALAPLPSGRAGSRLAGSGALGRLLGSGSRTHAAAVMRIGPGARPVRAILFDKNPAANWALGWHQDRTIAVRSRTDVPGFGPWTVKQGLLHVAPPFALLARMVTLRLHLDPVDEDNAPLLVAPGSHRLGRIGESAIDAAVARCGTATCLADRGDLWIYATPILHASESAARPRRRRVLQVDYSADTLPAPLEWSGI